MVIWVISSRRQHPGPGFFSTVSNLPPTSLPHSPYPHDRRNQLRTSPQPHQAGIQGYFLPTFCLRRSPGQLHLGPSVVPRGYIIQAPFRVPGVGAPGALVAFWRIGDIPSAPASAARGKPPRQSPNCLNIIPHHLEV